MVVFVGNMGVVGIDLGTTNTVVSCVRNGRVHVIADSNGDRLLPSVVSFHPNGEVLVGKVAKQRRMVDSKNTICSVKRLIGRSWQSDEIVKARQRFPFELREGPGQGPLVVARGQEYTLSEISAFILKRAKQIAEAAMGEPVDKAVITVPAHFNELQRSSTKVAGRVSGLEVLRILNEPTAAALAYGLGRGNAERIAVYDFGGGTFDCTLIDLNGNVFEVLATAGDTFLGGDDIDNMIAERMAEAFLMQHRYDPRADPQAFERLRLAAEGVKIALSTEEHTQIRIREVAYGVGGAQLDLNFGMTRMELEALVEPFIERSFRVTQDALALARMTPTSFDKVVLVGGSTRIPLVRRRVEQFFGTPPMDHVNPEEVVAVGAAIQAAALSDATRRHSIPAPPGAARPMDPDATQPEPSPPTRQMPPSIPNPARMADSIAANVARLRDDSSPTGSYAAADDSEPATVTRHAVPDEPVHADTPSQGFRAFGAIDEVPQVPQAPSRASQTDANQRSLARPSTMPMARPSAPPPPPLTASMPPLPGFSKGVSIPAAARVPGGGVRSPVLVDVTPRALVVETVGGFCDQIIPRNAKIPCERSRKFATGRDLQRVVRVRVAQGEQAQFLQNTYLGEVELTGIRPAPRGEVTIGVSFELDANGSLQVSAVDTTTGKEASATLQLVGVADESSVVQMTDRLKKMQVTSGEPS